VADDKFDQPPEWLLGAARIAQEYVDNPAVVAAMDAAQRITPLMKDIQARADAMETVRSTLEHLANFNSVASVLERQRSAMTEIASRLRGPVPQAAELEQAEATILNQLPETEEEVEEVAQAVAEIQVDPGKRSMIDRLTRWSQTFRRS
jgi:predicted Zn-dependent peptidase